MPLDSMPVGAYIECMKKPPLTLKEALKKMGMTQEVFATAVGIEQSYASRIINRRGTPTLGRAVRIHALTGVPYELLLEEKLHE